MHHSLGTRSPAIPLLPAWFDERATFESLRPPGPKQRSENEHQIQMVSTWPSQTGWSWYRLEYYTQTRLMGLAYAPYIDPFSTTPNVGKYASFMECLGIVFQKIPGCKGHPECIRCYLTNRDGS